MLVRSHVTSMRLNKVVWGEAISTTVSPAPVSGTQWEAEPSSPPGIKEVAALLPFPWGLVIPSGGLASVSICSNKEVCHFSPPPLLQWWWSLTESWAYNPSQGQQGDVVGAPLWLGRCQEGWRTSCTAIPPECNKVMWLSAPLLLR